MNKRIFITSLVSFAAFFSANADKSDINGKIYPLSTSQISKSLLFEPAKVKGYDNNLSPTTVFGDPDLEDMNFVINRSFKEELRVNIDKETISRMSGN
ncbi:MAG: hypothetical protein GX640_06600 [Fibrobacter sp.]|mgnify:CR=1 FL=1|nr:hypothetical protein [Fibrobacter sp.]